MDLSSSLCENTRIANSSCRNWGFAYKSMLTCETKGRLTKSKNEFHCSIPWLQYSRLSIRKLRKTCVEPQNAGLKINGTTCEDSFFNSEGLVL